MKIDTLEYWNDYSVSTLSGMPKQGEVHRFSHVRKEQNSVDGLILEIPTNLLDWLILKVESQNGANWVGLFEPGEEGISGLYATPSESIVCVIVKGQGYWVQVDSPETYEIIPSYPIKEVIAIPKSEKMIFVDFSRIAAYGKNGFAWQTSSLSWDGLDIDNVTSEKLSGLAWDAPNHQKVKFIVNVCDGSSSGGPSISPP